MNDAPKFYDTVRKLSAETHLKGKTIRNIFKLIVSYKNFKVLSTENIGVEDLQHTTRLNKNFFNKIFACTQ